MTILNTPTESNVVPILRGATLKRSTEQDVRERYLIIVFDGKTILRRLISKESWDWVFRDFPSSAGAFVAEPVPPAVQAEMVEYEGEAISTVKVSRANHTNERAALAPGIPFTSVGELATYLAEHDLTVIQEYSGRLY